MFKINELKNYVVPSAFVLKIIAGFCFIYIYTYHYGNGKSSYDLKTYFLESKELNEVFYKSPIDYIILFTGIGENTEIVQKHLKETKSWSKANQKFNNDTKNFIRFNSLTHFLSQGNIWVHILIINFISLIGLVQLFKGIHSYSKVSPFLLFSVILLLPSTLFWSSSIMKEMLLFTGIGFLLRGLLDVNLHRSKYFYIFFGLLLIWLFKMYVIFIVLICLALYFVYRNICKHSILKLGLIIIAIFIPVFFIFKKQFDDSLHLISKKQFDFMNVAKGGLHVVTDDYFLYFSPEKLSSVQIVDDSAKIIKPVTAEIIKFGDTKISEDIPLHVSDKKWKVISNEKPANSVIEIPLIQDSYYNLIVGIPTTFINAVFRPFPNDFSNNFNLPLSIESILVVIFLFIAIIFHRPVSQKERSIIYSLIVFAVFLFILIGITTPVVGAIVRYRFPAQLALVIAGLMMIKIPFKQKTTS